MRRILLLGVATLLSASALLAVAILLFGGHFGRTEGRILGTTAMLAGYGVLAIPAATLLDRGIARRLAWLDAALAVVAALVALAAIWSAGSDTLGKSVATLTIILLGVAQTALLEARRTGSETRLFAASIALAATAAALAVVALWFVEDNGTLARVIGAVVVLDLLTAALQPILGRASAEERTRLRVHLASGGTRELTIRGRVDRIEIL